MKLWKENKINNMYQLENKEIAKQFIRSIYGKHPYEYGGISSSLVFFITSKVGLNSSYEWKYKKGSIEGSKDILEIIKIVKLIYNKGLIP